MKLLITLIMLITSAATVASAGKEGGGGDPTEARVEEIRVDILKWIEDGGAKQLVFSENLTYDEYEEKMLNILENKSLTVEFTDQRPSLVSINGHLKTCINFYNGYIPKILCDIERFKKATSSEEYRLIHHEFAGLAGLEKNTSNKSDYNLSNQITDYLHSQSTLKLSVVKNNSPFIEIGELFSKGSVYRKYGKRHGWAGRCFSSTKDVTPHATRLTTYENGKGIRIQISGSKTPANFFDKKTTSHDRETEYLLTEIRNNSLNAYSSKWKFSIRVYKERAYVELSESDPNVGPLDLERTDAKWRCYYFIHSRLDR